MLKKICVIISAVVIITSLYINNKTPIFSGFAKSFEVHLTDYSESSAELLVNKEEFIFLPSIKGESCVIEDEYFDLKQYLEKMNATIIFTHEFNGCKNYYAYSPKIKYCKMIDGKMINLHVCIKNEQIKLGSPIIYGSF